MTFKPATRRPRTDLDRVFNTFFNTATPTATRPTSKRNTALNVIETADDFRLELAAPGWDKTDFKMEVKEEILTISATRKNTPVEGEKTLRQEFQHGNIKRTFHLPETVNAAKITAQYEQGILTISLPKKPEAKPPTPRQIEVA